MQSGVSAMARLQQICNNFCSARRNEIKVALKCPQDQNNPEPGMRDS
jgi:hypothetical protein